MNNIQINTPEQAQAYYQRAGFGVFVVYGIILLPDNWLADRNGTSLSLFSVPAEHYRFTRSVPSIFATSGS